MIDGIPCLQIDSCNFLVDKIRDTLVDTASILLKNSLGFILKMVSNLPQKCAEALQKCHGKQASKADKNVSSFQKCC